MDSLNAQFSKINIFIITILLLVSNDTLFFGTNANHSFFYIHIAVLILLFLYLFFTNKYIFSKKMFVFEAVLSSVFCLTMIINQDFQFIKYLYNMFLVALCGLVVTRVPIKEFVIIYKKIMYILSIFSIIAFTISFFAKNLLSYFPYIVNKSGFVFYYLGVGFVENLNYGIFPRVYSFFREPGVYMCFLVLAILFELFYSNKINIKHIMVNIIAVLLTFSTAAYILTAICLFVFYVDNFYSKNKKSKNQSFILILFLGFILLCFLQILGTDYVMHYVFGKLEVENASRDSRYASVLVNFQMFLDNPLLGKGWTFVENNFGIFASEISFLGNHNTNTYFKLLSLYGVIPFTILISGMISFFYSICRNLTLSVVLFGLWLITLSNEDLSVNFILYLLPLYGINTAKINGV